MHVELLLETRVFEVRLLRGHEIAAPAICARDRERGARVCAPFVVGVRVNDVRRESALVGGRRARGGRSIVGIATDFGNVG